MSRINFKISYLSCIYGRICRTKQQGSEHELAAVSRLHEVISSKIRVVAVQRRKLGKDRYRRKSHVGCGKHQLQNSGDEEIAVVHMRQEIGDAHGEDQRKAENDTVAELLRSSIAAA